jgi:aspartate aminotransferase
MGALLLSQFYQWTDNKPQVFVSSPTWVNHLAILRHVQLEPVHYPYYDNNTLGLDFSGFVGSLKAAPARSVFLLHACAHNPTGIDPSLEQWKEIAEIMLEKGHFAFFDAAYQGFASGDLDRDAAPVSSYWPLACLETHKPVVRFDTLFQEACRCSSAR